jgi:integrase
MSSKRRRSPPAVANSTGRGVSDFISTHRNQNTHKAYMSAWGQFERWAREIANPKRTRGARLNVERPDQYDVAEYCQYLVMDRGTGMSSVSTALAAIKDHLAENETAEYHPWTGHVIKQMTAALTPRARPIQQTKELTGTQVEVIINTVSNAASEVGLRDACMIELAYHTFLRASEIVRMDVGDITFTTEQMHGVEREVMRVHVNRLSKNDSERKGHERLVLGRGTQHDLCLVRRMRAYIRTLGNRTPAAPLFPQKGGDRMSSATPQHRLRHWLEACGEDPTRYTFHSLRAGGATDAAHAGVPERTIKAHGNWASDIVRRYLRENIEDRLATSSALAHGPAAAAGSQAH